VESSSINPKIQRKSENVQIEKHVLVIGNPNVGKSLIFNRLTGLRHKVANFPGVTVEVQSGEGIGELSDYEFIDYPGLYSLKAMSRDEEVAIENLKTALASGKFSMALCVLDSTRLERGLSLALHLKEILDSLGIKLLLVSNMIDEVVRSRELLDAKGLSQALGVPVLAVSAKTGEGFEALRKMIPLLLEEKTTSMRVALEDGSRFFSFHQELANRARELSARYGPKADVILKTHNNLDRWLLSGPFGALIFVTVMLFLFQAIFSWAAPLMDAVEAVVVFLGDKTAALIPEGTLHHFVKDAIFGGFGSFLVFAPQIFVLFLIIGFLEDSGYLARAAIISHRPLSFFGLSGRSFVPLLSGFACAIPAIMATRSIDSRRKRFLTILAVPLMACSARLPVYSLLIAAFIPAKTVLFGFVGLQGLAFFALYFFGIALALIATTFLSRTSLRKMPDTPFIIELPPYRMPSWRPILEGAATKAWSFIVKAGGVIFAVTVVIWVLGFFPNGQGHLESSYFGYLGRFIEPVFKPLGLDWKFGVAILTSFLAREVFVGTLGTLFGIEGADENIAGLADSLVHSGMTLASGIALLVFYAVALQCASTVAVIKKETQSTRIAIGTVVVYSLLAYGLAFVSYQVIRG
jgi:ferrous iron transport protein B